MRSAEVPVLALEDPASDALDRVRGCIARALEEDRAEAIVLGCAGMADLAQTLSDLLSQLQLKAERFARHPTGTLERR